MAEPRHSRDKAEFVLDKDDGGLVETEEFVEATLGTSTVAGADAVLLDDADVAGIDLSDAAVRVDSGQGVDLGELSDEEDFLDALDQEVRQLEEAGITRDQQASRLSLEETKKDFERSANEYEQRQRDQTLRGQRQPSAKTESQLEEEELDSLRQMDAEDEAIERREREKEEERQRTDDELIARQKREEAMSHEEREDLRQRAQILKKKGNELYASGEGSQAVEKYSEALDHCPLEFKDERAVFVANRAAAKLLESSLESALEDCHEAIRLKPDYLKAYARRGNIYEQLDKPHEAMKDFEKVLEMDKDHREARKAVQRLPEKIAKKDEEIKQEMFANLKKLGNMVLNPFGLSTENFNFVKDENTGSFSVNFNQNPGGGGAASNRSSS